MRRRDFITLVGGAAATSTWSLASRAQQPAMPVIGFLNPQSSDGHRERVRSFRQGLKETGYFEGENVAIEYRWADGQFDRLPALAAELVRRQVSVIAATGGVPSARAAKEATATIPITFLAAEDPVGVGLVTSFSRPGGNLTGINFLNTELGAKRLELVRELVPRAERVAVLVNPANAINAGTTLRDAESAARAIGLQVQVVRASTSGEINAAFAGLKAEPSDLASRHAVPTVYADRQFPEVGGLISYGTNIPDAWRQAGVYTGRILKGAKPADMPIVQADRFELVINVETARMLGLSVPPTLLARADEVIE